MAIVLRTEAEIEQIRRAGHLCARILAEAADACAAGESGTALDALVRNRLRRAGAEAVLAAQAGPAGPFPGALSVSTGQVLANGPPGGAAPAPGDPVRLDLALRLDGWVCDCSTTALFAASASAPLLDAARAITHAAIAAMAPGTLWSDVLEAGLDAAAEAGVHAVEWPWGHGVGRQMHEPPPLPADPADPGAGFRLQRGMVLAVEPIVTQAPAHIRPRADGWSLLGPPGVRAACEERTVAITPDGAEILTPLPGADLSDPAGGGA